MTYDPCTWCRNKFRCGDCKVTDLMQKNMQLRVIIGKITQSKKKKEAKQCSKNSSSQSNGIGSVAKKKITEQNPDALVER